MFTGIITHLGKIAKKTPQTLTILANRQFLSKIEKGISVSINGICLTVVNTDKQYFQIDFMPETENRTNIKYLEPNDLVNLELPATPTSFLSGHIVQGHIDETSKLLSITLSGNSKILKFSTSSVLTRYMVEKGSITINGVSLTLIKVGKKYFTVGIIPFTWEKTMFHTLKTADYVNIETDILAKYIKKLLK